MKSIGRESMLEQAWAKLEELRKENKKLKAKVKVKELEAQVQQRNETLDEVLGVV